MVFTLPAELAALWDQIAKRRAANMRLFVADLATDITPPPRVR